MGGFAWVTLATNDSYSLGALVLAHSLKQVGTQQQLAVLVTPGVTNPMRVKLAQVFNVVQEVNILDSKDTANLRLLKRPELGITFTKLHCWRLTQFDKCVFLDADTLVLQNCDELFEREELSAAPDVGWPDCFNSGVFVYRPSNDTYEKLIQFALEKGSFDGGDQGLLNLYFSDWAHKDISKHLPFIYNMCSTACYSYLPAYKQFGADAKIIHFIGVTKPWLQYFDTETKTVHPSDEARHIQDVLQRWWDIFCSLIHPNLTPDMSGLAGAFAQLTLGTPRTPEQAALDDHLRRQGWEVGNIDYLGRDSFENIWSKICETLSSGPEQPAQPTPQPKAPSPPVSSEVKPPEQPPAEVISQQKPSPEPEKPQEPEPVKEEPEPIKEEPVVLEKVETQSAEPKTSPEANLPQESATPETESPKPAPEPIIPQPVPESPKPDEPVKSELPQPVEEIATLKSEEASKLAETVSAEPPTVAAPPAENLEIKPPSAAVEESPKPAAEVVPSTPESLPESPKPVAESPVSPTSAPEPVTESPKPPETIPASEAVPESPKLTSEAAPESPKPTSEISTESPKPTSEISPESPKPTAETLPESPKPALQVAPESPKAATEAIAAPTPVPESPKPIPDTIAEPPAVASPAPAPETVPASLKSAPEPEKAEPKPAESPKATPQSPKPTPESPKPVPQSPKPEAAPQVCPFAPKSPAEKKPSAKKSSSKEAPQPPKPEVTEATPPTSPVSPQPKQSKQQALVVDTSVPDTPPPASSEASAATPTPPPRKSSGAPKKPSTKTKK